jgi:hypothetical protein
MNPVLAIAILFTATGQINNAEVVGSGKTMEACAKSITEGVEEHANAIIPKDSGMVLKGYCADPVKGLFQEEVTVGSAKAALGQK